MSTTGAEAQAELDRALALANRTTFSMADVQAALRLGTAAGLTLEQVAQQVESASRIGMMSATGHVRGVVTGRHLFLAEPDPAPASIADRWDHLAGSVRHLGSVLREEAIGNWRPLAIATGLTWLGLVIALVIA